MSKIRNFIFGVSFFLGFITSFILAAGVDGRATQDQLVVLFVIALILFGVALAARFSKS